jgi:hypothetical protein
MKNMNTKESENDKYGTYITGLTYTSLLAIILLIICLGINDKLFDSTITYVLIIILCILFFYSGIKKVDKKKLGYLVKLGTPDFSKYYNQGIYWIFPLWKFEQQEGIGYLIKPAPVKLSYYTQDRIPLQLTVSYCWKVTDPEKMYLNDQPSVIEDALKSSLSNFVQNRHSIEVLSDLNTSIKMIGNYLNEIGDKVGINFEFLYPTIEYSETYKSDIDKFRNKFQELSFRIEELNYKKTDMEVEKNQILYFISEAGFSRTEALNYLKVYKNQINVNENTYNLNIGDLNKMLEAVMSFFK